MSCLIYRNGETIKVPAHQLQVYLDSGWSTQQNDESSKPTALGSQISSESQAEATTETVPVPIPAESVQDDLTETEPTAQGKLTAKHVRNMARKAGIANWDKAKLKTLRAQLGIQNE